MPASQLARIRAFLPGVPGSILLHLLLLVALGLASMVPVDREPPYPESSVDVELLTPHEFDALTRPNPIAVVPQAAPIAPAPTLPESERLIVPTPESAPSETMVRATKLQSAQILAQPRSREARETMRHLAEDERLEQLCGIEAMSQIHAWNRAFEPDRVAAYAMLETKLSGATLLAEGAAFRSKRRWFNLRFKCGVTADHRQVAAFEFRVGEPIPASEWRARNLPGEY